MATLTVRELTRLAVGVLVRHGFSPGEAARSAEEFVAAELAGVRSHGLGKLALLNLGDPLAEPVFDERGAVLRVDGSGGSGLRVMPRVADRLVRMARANGAAVAAVRNFSRYGALSPYTERVARHGLIAVLCNTAGPPVVAPFGAASAVTGTNPICFSFPAADGPHTADFATAAAVWGEIRQAALEGRDLPAGPFLDGTGAVTTSPERVESVRAFGDARGFALNLAVEILAGPAIGAAAGTRIHTEFDCGAFMAVLDPEWLGAGGSFAHGLAALLDDVRAARPAGAAPVRAPGDRAPGRIDVAGRQDEPVEVPDATIGLLTARADGVDDHRMAGDPRYT
ncbi:Ldh family oxidoreductase [Catenuloplanes atrovinosus]|uniref:Ureidoglycolate dehydrogenase (NAD+)/L-2-hydroxycarboxylate dehydrogenase (NAD+) n=1 Tax=Catenuloplanes atrovinosus TaxID=137266 RepID=A0AAE3YJL9_9ACTN|nr:Ldh family oxidoreductase [Catenuloplanes atrovinosus]MDR7273625.1 ureidoglycolate dehydrogenase (NAD+)/L-2-hydroxycarboxylate dehydrogenase (NAD+) [Catenuloplanes atrovinosus]